MLATGREAQLVAWNGTAWTVLIDNANPGLGRMRSDGAGDALILARGAILHATP